MTLSYAFQILETTRQNVLNLIEGLSTEQMLVIPPGFRNNILWNAGHMVATQQLLLYGLSGMPFQVPQDFIDTFRKGTEARTDYPAETITFIRENLLPTVRRAAVDYQNRNFGDFKTYPTSYGIELHSLEEAIQFNNTHEGLHLGYMMALRKAVA